MSKKPTDVPVLSPDLSKRPEIRRYSFLSAYTARNDAEEAEVQELHKQYGEVTGWTLYSRDPMFAPGGEYHTPTKASDA